MREVGHGEAAVQGEVVHLVHDQALERPVRPGGLAVKLLPEDVGGEVVHGGVDDVRLVDPPQVVAVPRRQGAAGEAEILKERPPLFRVPLGQDGRGADDVDLLPPEGLGCDSIEFLGTSLNLSPENVWRFETSLNL